MSINAPFYCGVGSRETPEPVLEQMTGIACVLKEMGYILRSGHASGADLAFEKGSEGHNQIWLPWADFNYENPDSQGLVQTGHYVPAQNWVAEQIAHANHPDWDACNTVVRRVHIRTVYQILGPGLGVINQDTISKFVLCWTKDREVSGGTGQAIRIAESCKIPVFNLFYADALEKLETFLSEQE